MGQPKLPFFLYSVKKYLDAELAKFETWEDVTSNESIRCLFDNQTAFQTTKKERRWSNHNPQIPRGELQAVDDTHGGLIIPRLKQKK